MSGLPFELLLALRYLRPKRSVVSVITLISVAGVAIGVAVLIIVISVMSGFDKQIRDSILSMDSHAVVSIPGEPIPNYRGLMQVISSNIYVQAVAPTVATQVLMETTTNEHTSKIFDSAPYVRGIDPEYETNVSAIATSMVDGKFDVSGHGILLGSILASNFDIKVGDIVNISTAQDMRKMVESSKTGTQIAIPPMEYEVRGIFQIGYNDFDSSVVVISLPNVQDMSNLGDSVHSLLVMLKDPFTAGRVQQELEHTLGPPYRVHTWMENHLMSAVAVEKNVMFIILFCVMIVAALCILSALITFVVQKTREIGMLKALGATDFQVGGLFLSQSAFIGIVGVLTGLGVGLLALKFRNEFLELMRRVTGLELFPAAIYQLPELPALVVPGDILLICGSALVICVFGGVIPAWRAWRLKPVEALRYE